MNTYLHTFAHSLTFQSDTQPITGLIVEHEMIAKDSDTLQSTNHVMLKPHDDTTTVAPISLDSIFERDYLYPTTSTWDVTQPRFSLIAQINLPEAFLDLTSIAPYGALQFHALYKSDFRITIRADNTEYGQGVAIAFSCQETL